MSNSRTINGFSLTAKDVCKILRVNVVDDLICTVIHDHSNKPIGLISNSDHFYFNEVKVVSPKLTYFYRDASPGYKWRLGINTDTGCDNDMMALYLFCINDEAYEYDSYIQFAIGTVQITATSEHTALALFPTRGPSALDAESESEDEQSESNSDSE